MPDVEHAPKLPRILGDVEHAPKLPRILTDVEHAPKLPRILGARWAIPVPDVKKYGPGDAPAAVLPELGKVMFTLIAEVSSYDEAYINGLGWLHLFQTARSIRPLLDRSFVSLLFL